MSRAITIKVSETVTRRIHVDDAVATKLRLLDILPPGRMAAHIAAAAEGKHGFERQEDGTLRRVDGDIEIAIDPRDAGVSVRIAHESDETVEIEGTARTWDDAGANSHKQAQEQARADARKRIEEGKADEAIAKLAEARRRDITARLESRLSSLQQELSALAHEATANALVEKARTLGTVAEVSRDDDAQEVRILVETP